MAYSKQDQKFLRYLKIDPETPTIEQVTKAYQSIGDEELAEAMLRSDDFSVSFEAFVDVCQQRSRFYDRAMSAEAQLRVVHVVVDGLKGEVARLAEKNKTAAGQNLALSVVLALALIAVYGVGSFGNVW